MFNFLKKHRYFYSFIGIFLFVELIVDPRGEFPLNDDWSYSKSVLNWLKDGNFSIGEWPAMTLLTHLLWGMLFTKIVGFSFFVLRISTLVSSFIGIWFLYKLIYKLSGTSTIAFTAALVMLFNPIYFTLSNTYMTDVNFNTILVICCYFAYDFFTFPGFRSLILVMIFSIVLVLTRQFGLIVPISFSITCLGLKNKRWTYFTLAVFSTICVVAILRVYENYLHSILPKDVAYKYTADVNPLLRVFWNVFFLNLKLRYATILMHILVYTFPFTIMFFWSFVKEFKFKLISTLILIIGAFTYFIFDNEPFPMGNVFINFDVGAETYYESLSPSTSRSHEHNYSPLFEKLMYFIKLIFIVANTVFIALTIIKLKSKNINIIAGNPAKMFFVLLAIFYSVLLLISNFYFDRYHLPLILIFIIVFSYVAKIVLSDFGPAIVLILIMVYVSVLGTKDYINSNSKRWEAYYYLIKKEGVNRDKINAGFEPNCWNEGEQSWWYLFHDLNRYDFLIQYHQEKGFRLFREIEFQRYFPYKKDKLNIFVKDSLDLTTKGHLSGGTD